MAQDSDEHLIRYLLGELPPQDAEGLDELSITDDAIALRLRALEDELVDRYARGERRGGSLERFAQAHRVSKYLQEKVRFAEALHGVRAAAETRTGAASSRAHSARLLIAGLATAAVIAIAVAGYLLVANARLRSQLAALERRQAAPAQQDAPVQPSVEQTPTADTARPAPITATFLLLPPRRGLDDDTTITIPPKSNQVELRLRVESDDYQRFRGRLKGVPDGRIIWRSPDLTSTRAGADRIVTMVVPVAVLRAQRYAIELLGIGSHDSSDTLAEYPIRVVLP